MAEAELESPIAATLDDNLLQFLYRVPIGLVQTTRDGTVEMMNPKAVQLLMPIASGANLGNLFEIFADRAPELRALSDACVAPSGIVCESRRIAIDDLPGVAPRTLSIGLTKLDATRLIAVVGDATADADREQQDMATQLRHAGRVDALTAMPNRTALRERVQAAIDREPVDAGYEFAVLFLNCDRFKQINDSHGHQVGDEVLAAMAGRLATVLRPGDSVGRVGAVAPMAARVSGDEFVVLLEGLRHSGDVHVVAARLLEALSKVYVVGALRLRCTASIGIVTRALASGDADVLLQDASIAMDEAKRSGGARYALFEPALRNRAVQRGGVEAELRRGIESGELFVMYQPVVGLRAPDGSVDRHAGVEALVRWRHPTRGVVAPAEFIGIAEETGLIEALGLLVLDTACRAFVAWRERFGERAPRTLAVNLSRAQLGAPGIVASVRDVLQSTGMPAEALQLEITESLAAQDLEIQSRLHELKTLGLTIALDDFGTGYSSLSSLHLLPVDTVKIDRSFVDAVATSGHHRALVEATIHVARSLGMQTIAEGIETEAQAAVIGALGCDKGQGYLYSRPLAVADLEAWLGRDAI